MTETRVKPLLELPENIHGIRSEFVEKLTDAVGNAKRTADNYVVTPPLVEAFEKALKIVGSSLRDSRSRAAFLHGSFGSGKSHFMALLSLLLDGNEEAWRLPELHALRAKNDFIGRKKLLQLHFHVTGSTSLEGAIFQRYVAWVAEHHPKAPVPGLFADEKLFANARDLLDELGEEQFFAAINPKNHNAEWGSFDDSVWTRARFEECATSTDPEQRGKLFSVLVKTRFTSFAAESRQYIDLDAGLAVMGRHAKALGYDGVVLFLDELILWLATRSNNVEWFHNEVQKMVKLVESQDARRDVPFISFIARQRDLAEMVGEDYAGLENKLVRDSLRWNEGRYETVTLEDRNLPAIVEKRILKPKDAGAKKALDDAFDKLKKSAADPAWRTMIGEKDAADFRRLYPFSPALVDALVALSNALQRERTAIKLLNELLVEHIEDLKVGDVVCVGDLWDVLAGGEDSADGVMKARFDSAKFLYTHRFLPMLQEQHGTNTAAKCQRLRPDHPARLGCSNCPNTACRNDNRVIKTLIVASLVPEVPAFKELTASKLVQLNHGTVRVPVPGTEATIITKRLRDWAANTAAGGQLHVGQQADPSVSLQLEGVDLAPILKQGEHFDQQGARTGVLRDLLFDAIGLSDAKDTQREHKVLWRGSERVGHIRFGNVRKLPPDALRCPEDHDWRLVIDYPFDDAGFGPHDDEEVVDSFRDQGGSWTLVWLPSFFSHTMNQKLGELVVLDRILENARNFVGHLSIENQQRAINDLNNLRSQVRARVVRALEQAYGLSSTKNSDDIDGAQTIGDHFRLLKAGTQLQTQLVANFRTALDTLLPAVLEARFPRHPKFAAKLTPQRVERLVEKFGEIVDNEEKKIAADRGLVDEMRGSLEQLGLVRVSEAAVHLVEERLLQDIEKRRQQQSNERPEVGELRHYIDESGKMGLQPEACDLVIRCYARWSARTFVSGNAPYDVKSQRTLPDHIVLEKPDLPSHEAWAKALALAGACLGVVLPGKALHADNLKRFEAEVLKIVKTKQAACARYPARLRDRLGEVDIHDADRAATAASADALLSLLLGRAGRSLVEALATFEPKTSTRAVAQSIARIDENLAVVDDDLVFGPFAQLRSKANALSGADELLQNVARALRQDEVNEALAVTLRDQAKRAQVLLRAHEPAPTPTAPAGRVVWNASLKKEGRADALAELKRLVAEAERALADNADGDVSLTGSLTLTLTANTKPTRGGT